MYALTNSLVRHVESWRSSPWVLRCERNVEEAARSRIYRFYARREGRSAKRVCVSWNRMFGELLKVDDVHYVVAYMCQSGFVLASSQRRAWCSYPCCHMLFWQHHRLSCKVIIFPGTPLRCNCWLLQSNKPDTFCRKNWNQHLAANKSTSNLNHDYSVGLYEYDCFACIFRWYSCQQRFIWCTAYLG